MLTHVCKVFMTPQQYELISTQDKHRYALFCIKERVLREEEKLAYSVFTSIFLDPHPMVMIKL